MSALVEDKAKALLVAGCVHVREVTETGVVVDVDGHHGAYVVSWVPAVGWRCTCPERRGACSHLAAVRRVVPATDAARPGGGAW